MDKARSGRRRRGWFGRILAFLSMTIGGLAVVGVAAVTVVAYQAGKLILSALGGLLTAFAAYATLYAMIVSTLILLSLMLVLSMPPLLAPFTPAARALAALTLWLLPN